MAGKTVKLFGLWLSPYALRVQWALHLKGIEYEYVEEDLANKSPLLLQYNPVHKKVPVLVHGEKSIAESPVIIEYIDETWKNNPLLPEDPYDRAMTRFWAKYAEEKCLPALFSVFSTVGEDQEKAIKEVQESMKVFERGLHGKRFFGGESIGFVDIIAGWFAYWVPLNEEVLGKTLVDERDLPELKRWFQDFLDTDWVKAILPPRDKLLAHLQGYREKFTSSSV
ncbi:glutathione transferase GST 23-like [Aristolochia californica]|uniref:glutathione transferase GST 23-like n=1 Tax=Aristolochia californica TaxID=171875 RepID=UPI0035DBB19D